MTASQQDTLLRLRESVQCGQGGALLHPRLLQTDLRCPLVDVELSVKNGAELLDRLVKDIVTERSSYFHNQQLPADAAMHPLSVTPEPLHNSPLMHPRVPGATPSLYGGITPSQFNLPRFIPLLKERMHVLTPPGRIFLVQWIFVLNR